jgi:hypothetical protein
VTGSLNVIDSWESEATVAPAAGVIVWTVGAAEADVTTVVRTARKIELEGKRNIVKAKGDGESTTEVGA